MGTESLLNEYLANARAQAERLESSEVAKRVEAAFEELKLPWRRDGDGWEIASDVGVVAAGLDEAQEVLTFHQMLGELTKPPKKMSDLLYNLLVANFGTTGACFAIFEPESGGPPVLAALGRIAAESVDPGEVALTLESLFRLSVLID